MKGEKVLSTTELIRWMEANPNLAGWGQAIGAGIAICVAIAVPAWQRHADQRDKKNGDADLNAVLAQSLFFLVSDLRDYLNGLKIRAEMPRRMLEIESTITDFVARIATLEAREIDVDRNTVLFRCRGVIQQTATAHVKWLADKPLSTAEQAFLTKQIAAIDEFKVDAKNGMDRAFLKRAAARFPWVLRPLLYLAWKPLKKIVGAYFPKRPASSALSD